MNVLHMGTNIAMKVNYEHKVIKLYEDSLVPSQDYYTSDMVLSSKDEEIKNIQNKLLKLGFINA